MLYDVYMGNFLGSEEMNNTCGNMTCMGTIDRDIAVVKHIHSRLI